MSPADVRAQVVASRRAQGLPDHIIDRGFLDQLAKVVLGAEAGERDAS